ncbi:hypothetical protein [Bradyrhizobium sp. USDA 10063]
MSKDRAVKILQSDKDAPMKPSAHEQKRNDQTKQLRRYHAWKNSEAELLARGPSGEQWRALRSVLRQMSIEETVYLPDYIRRQTWLLEADELVRAAVLDVIENALIRLRIRNGYAPIDDALPGEPPTAFERIRDILQVT